MNPQTVFN